MSSLIAGVEAGFEPIPGYVLRERIGSGGYGEVWMADAPGGLKKAVKFVYGTVDERAGSELRALQRIRSVNHPFILSLERIEVIDKQLVVITELADGTLLDRFHEYQQRGLVGIPRTKLIEYLRDTADALDFLCQKHELQHLDVKPANLLLVADRVKVADFGLIKDIQNKSMSMMSGMTPTYAAPEMFDGRPGRNSDLYSLAIVYQEMLTGRLPFQGRTTAQLATEHLHKAPNLESLPLNERPIVAKALAKKPSQRHSSCREFIDDLIRVAVDASPALPPTVARSSTPATAKQTPRAAPTSNSRIAPRTHAWEKATGTMDVRGFTVLPPLDLTKCASSNLAPCLFVGLGNTGGKILQQFRARLSKNGLRVDSQSDMGWCLVDTDESDLRSAMDSTSEGNLSFNDIVHLSLRPASEYRQRDQTEFSPLSRRWLYNVPRSGLTEGVRPMAMLALLDHALTTYDYLRRRIESLAEQLDNAGPPKPLRVYLLGSSHGATGSVLAIEIAFLLRQLCDELKMPHRIQLVLTAAEQGDGVTTELATASSIACLREIAHYFRTDGLHPGIPGIPANHSASPPWNFVYIVPGGRLGRSSGWKSAIQQISDFLCIDACTALGEALDASRDSAKQAAQADPECEWQPWLRTFAARKVDLFSDIDPVSLVKRCIAQQSQEWLVALRGPKLTEALSETEPSNAPITATKARIVDPQIDSIVSDLFREQHWTAQLWVRSCMEFLVPVSHGGPNASRTSQPLSGVNSSLDNNDLRLSELGIEGFCGELGLSLSASQEAARGLLDSSIETLRAWIERHVLTSMSRVARMSDLVYAIDRRFETQCESLRVVSERLRGQRDDALAQLHYRSNKANGDGKQVDLELQELSQLVRSYSFQASIHAIAGRMLRRLNDYITLVVDNWRQHIEATVSDLKQWVSALALDLGVPLDQDGTIREVWTPIPSAWHPIRESINKSIIDTLQKRIQPGFVRALAEKRLIRPVKENERTNDGESDPHPTVRTDEEAIKLSSLVEKCVALAIEEATSSGLIRNEDNESDAEGSDASHFAADDNLFSTHVQTFENLIVQNGAAIRKLLLLPNEVVDDELLERIEKNVVNGATVVELEGIGDPLLCIDGEQLDPSDLIKRLWAPTPDRDQLAERLRSRNDLDWLKIDSE